MQKLLIPLVIITLGAGCSLKPSNTKTPQVQSPTTSTSTPQIAVNRDRALAIVSNLPEVKEFMRQGKAEKKDVHVGIKESTDYFDDIQDNNGNTIQGTFWSVQVYENLGDHNSTSAWYAVDAITGKVYNLSK